MTWLEINEDKWEWMKRHQANVVNCHVNIIPFVYQCQWVSLTWSTVQCSEEVACSNQCSLAGHTLQSDTTGPARLYSILGTPSIFIVGVARCVGGGACTLSFWLFIPTRTLHHRWYRQVDVRRVIIEMAEATAVEVETSQVVTQVGEVSFVWIYKSYHFTDIIGCLGIDGVATTQAQDWS